MRPKGLAGIIPRMETVDNNPLNTDASLLSYREENRALREENARQKEQLASFEQRLRWFEKQLFGQKSEKRPVDNPHQPGLDLGETTKPLAPEGEKTTVTYQRSTGKKQRPDDCVNDAGLRFNDDVPVEVIDQQPPELSGPEADQYEIIGIKTVYRLAQRPASYVVLQYNRPVLKRKDQEKPESCPAPDNVLERSLADVSLLVGLLVDKFQYHLPLYRQHQRIQNAGVTLSRATLTNVSKRAIELLRPSFRHRWITCCVAKCWRWTTNSSGTNLNSRRLAR